MRDQNVVGLYDVDSENLLSILSCEISWRDGVKAGIIDKDLSILSCEIRINPIPRPTHQYLHHFQFSLARSDVARSLAKVGPVIYFQFSLARSEIDGKEITESERSFQFSLARSAIPLTPPPAPCENLSILSCEISHLLIALFRIADYTFNSLLRDQHLRRGCVVQRKLYPFNSLLRDQLETARRRLHRSGDFQFSLARSATMTKTGNPTTMNLSILSCEISIQTRTFI